MVELTISMHFLQFEDLKFLIFLESRIPTGLQSEHEYPDFEEQLSQANEQRNIFLFNYHKICHKINKLLNLDIQVNFELQS